MMTSIRPSGVRGEAELRSRRSRRWSPTTPAVLVLAGALVVAWIKVGGLEAFAQNGTFQKRKSPAPYGRIGGKPIIPNPEAEKFPGGVPRDEDGFPVISLREQYETNVTMYSEGLGPYPGEAPDFSKDWDFIPLDPEDPGFDADAALGPAPPDAPEDLMSLQAAGSVVWPTITPDDGPAGGGKKRKVAASPE
mmetsp:Transcript_55948/g.90522  ORF Transcript_55948/g.90522 Transcript_55948/m.90522 type:complete len:192 (+) Transcript_55948:109-684(+)